MTSENSIPQKTIDVSSLPSTMFDTHAPIWWGNTWGLVIETVVFGCLIAAYFSIWTMLSPFPPPRVDRFPIISNPVPDLTIPPINLVVLLVSLIPDILLDLNARKKNEKGVKIFLVVTLAFNIAAIILRFYEFDSLHFKWNDNAYGSITWTILGMHLIHLFVMACEDIFGIVWVFAKGLDEKQAFDLTVTAVYWYWVVGVWVLLYALVYLGPRFL
ncbi:cytochrome c oxidase subunit 3 [soil metagenome]